MFNEMLHCKGRFHLVHPEPSIVTFLCLSLRFQMRVGTSVIRILICVLMVLMAATCTTNVVVEGTVPTPLVARIPARVGVFYPEEFRNFHYQEVIRDAGTWNIDIGSQNLSFFRNLTQALCISVEEVSEPTFTPEEMRNLDAIMVPHIEKYGFLTPSISGLKFYSASIEYRIVMYDRVGQEIGDWNIIGYGKSEAGVFSRDEAVNEATVLAIRDGGARIAIELIDQPSVQAWLREVQGRAEQTEGAGQ